MVTDDGGLLYEAGHPQEEGQTWQDAHLWRKEGDKGGHGSRNIMRESRHALPALLETYTVAEPSTLTAWQHSAAMATHLGCFSQLSGLLCVLQ